MAFRRLVAASTAVVLAAAVTGCTSRDAAPARSESPAPTSSPRPSVTASPRAEEVDLDVAVYGDEPRLRTYRTMAAAFTRQHPEVRLHLRDHPDAATATGAALAGLRSGNGPDVFLADQFALPALVSTGRLQPVDTLLEDRGLQFGDEYQRTALTSFSANNRLQCMPAEMSPRVVYVNTKLVPRRSLRDDVTVPTVRHPSWGWGDLLALARVAAATDGLGPVKGVSLPVDLHTLTAFVRSAGGEVVDDVLQPTSLTLASDDAVAALSSVLSLAGDASLAPTPEQLERRDAVARFAAGELGMFVGSRDAIPRLRAAAGLRFDVWPLPSMGRAQTVADANGFCIDSGSGEVDAAADFIAFAVGAVGARIAARSGVMVPSLLSAVHQDAFLQPTEPPRSAEMFAVALRRTEPMPYSIGWPLVSRAADQVMQELVEEPVAELPEQVPLRMTQLDRRSERLFADTAEVPSG